MRIRGVKLEDESPVNMTPMIDMVFLLLVFFLVATTFVQIEKEQSVNLPGGASDVPLSAEARDLVINVTKNGDVIIGGKTFSREELASLLNHVARNEADRQVLIRADKDSRHEFFARVVEAAHKAGINKAKIGYSLDLLELIK